jgi:pyruvate/2-oxoacid:ferredoxin oxidoreductase alpha subunit
LLPASKKGFTVKDAHKRLDKIDPFTEQEKRGLGKRNMAFIRDLQISRQLTKDEAKDLYAQKNLESKEALKALANEARKAVEYRYQKADVFKVPVTSKFDTTIILTTEQREKMNEEKLLKWKKEEKKKLTLFFASEKFKRTVTYSKVKSGHKKYPDATLFELRKGVNSKASQKFRENHGLTKEYSGKIKE